MHNMMDTSSAFSTCGEQICIAAHATMLNIAVLKILYIHDSPYELPYGLPYGLPHDGLCLCRHDL